MTAPNPLRLTTTLLFGDPLEVVELSAILKNSFLLQRIQDEVRTALLYLPPSAAQKIPFSSQLDGIDGLGPKHH